MIRNEAKQRGRNWRTCASWLTLLLVSMTFLGCSKGGHFSDGSQSGAKSDPEAAVQNKPNERPIEGDEDIRGYLANSGDFVLSEDGSRISAQIPSTSVKGISANGSSGLGIYTVKGKWKLREKGSGEAYRVALFASKRGEFTMRDGSYIASFEAATDDTYLLIANDQLWNAADGVLHLPAGQTPEAFQVAVHALPVLDNARKENGKLAILSREKAQQILGGEAP